MAARYPNHLWRADLTEIPGFLRIFSSVLAVVIDVHSRMPLAARLFPTQPSAADLVALLGSAVERHGRPRHFVSDQGAQFMLALAKKRAFLAGEGFELGGEVFDVPGVWRQLEDFLDSGKEVVEGPDRRQWRT